VPLTGGHQGRPDRGVLLQHALGCRLLVVLLERHARGVEPCRRDGVSVPHVEEVVGTPVEVVETGVVERLLHRLAVDVVDPVERGLADVVVDGVGVRREEVALASHLVRVDEQLGRQLAQLLDLAVGLRLGAGEPVAVEVEAVGVAPGVRLAAVGVLGGQDHHDGAVQDRLGRAVGAGSELVEDTERGVGAALLAAVDVAGHPQDRRCVSRDASGLLVRRAGVTERVDLAGDRAESTRLHPLLLPDHGVAQRPAVPRAAQHAVDDLRAGVGDRPEVAVGLRGRDIPLPQLDAEDLLRRRHLEVEHRLCLERLAGGAALRRWCAGRRAGDGRGQGYGERERGAGPNQDGGA
jgi:hypothetical protein